jgi:hypothetical protein
MGKNVIRGRGPVETIFVGKDRQYNRRFLQMCSHYLVQPVACTPASGWEKGQFEKQVGLVRERFFTPRLRFKSYAEYVASALVDRLQDLADVHVRAAALLELIGTAVEFAGHGIASARSLEGGGSIR